MHLITPNSRDASLIPEFTPAEFERFRKLLLEKSGLFFDDSKMVVVRNVIHERMNALGMREYNDYFHLLNEPIQNQPPANSEQAPTGHRLLSKEMRRLVEGVAVNETSFFRNREHYRALQEEVLPRLIRREAKKKQLRIWSAGCSTGQEPYTLAMATLETLREQGHNPDDWKIEIFASDISEKALRIAYSGRYRSDEMRGLSEEQIKLYFQPLSARTVATAPLDPNEIYQPGRSQALRHRQRIAYEVNPQIRQLVSFNFFNLTMPVFPSDKFHDFDLVLCENVTIYFSPEITKQVIDNIYAVMVDGAFLFIGYSETLWQVSDRFKLINTQDTFYYQKPFPNEDASRYVRRRPTTGPLSIDRDPPPTSRPTNNSATPRTDELRQRYPLPTDAERRKITNPLQKEPVKPEAPPVIGHLAVSGGNQPRRVISGPVTAQPEKEKPTKAVKANIDDWRPLLTEGRQFMKEHEFDLALASLEAAMQAGPNEVDVLCALAELKVKLGDYAKAMNLSLLAITLNPLAEAAHLMLAMIYHKEGRIEEAIQEYKNTIYVNLDAVIAYMRLADIYRDTGHQRDALREYRRALNVLQQKAPDEMIEDLSVSLLMQACQQNITRLGPRQTR